MFHAEQTRQSPTVDEAARFVLGVGEAGRFDYVRKWPFFWRRRCCRISPVVTAGTVAIGPESEAGPSGKRITAEWIHPGGGSIAATDPSADLSSSASLTLRAILHPGRCVPSSSSMPLERVA